MDSGALFTAIPRAMLEGLGLRPVARRKLRVFGGDIIERDMSGAVVDPVTKKLKPIELLMV